MRLWVTRLGSIRQQTDEVHGWTKGILFALGVVVIARKCKNLRNILFVQDPFLIVVCIRPLGWKFLKQQTDGSLKNILGIVHSCPIFRLYQSVDSQGVLFDVPSYQGMMGQFFKSVT